MSSKYCFLNQFFVIAMYKNSEQNLLTIKLHSASRLALKKWSNKFMILQMTQIFLLLKWFYRVFTASSTVQKRHRQQLVGILSRQRDSSPQHQQRADIGSHHRRHGRRIAQVCFSDHNPHFATWIFISRPTAADCATSCWRRHRHLKRVVARAISTTSPEEPLGQQWQR